VSPAPRRPTIALAMGDPCGISAELTAKLLVDPEVLGAADFIVIGDRRVLGEGERIAGVKVDCTVWKPGGGAPATNRQILFVDLGHLAPQSVEQGVSSRAGGAFALTNFRTILRLGAKGAADAIAFTPFNKHAMKLALASYEDEIAVITEETGAKVNGREFNILDNLWNARVTSHVPLKDVAKYITKSAVLNGIELTDRCMREAGIAKPRIAVAGLNPHAGDGGNFGREEIDEIEPAVEAAKAKGIACEGPFPPDTVFVRARRGDFDAVQTMFHDQGQIAMKLMGFERGVTLIAGYGFPICTPAHGTAYDIAGKGIANPGASRNAMLIAAAMAKPADIDAAGRAQRIEAVISSVRAAA
jgi:4-hydroxythreonine-4-phosphate dehydrogenase